MRVIHLDDRKYSVHLDEHSGVIKALRYGKEWRDLTGDKLFLSLLYVVLGEATAVVEEKEYPDEKDYSGNFDPY